MDNNAIEKNQKGLKNPNVSVAQKPKNELKNLEEKLNEGENILKSFQGFGFFIKSILNINSNEYYSKLVETRNSVSEIIGKIEELRSRIKSGVMQIIGNEPVQENLSPFPQITQADKLQKERQNKKAA